LKSECVPEVKISFVGIVMIDTLFRCLPAAEKRGVLPAMGLEAQGYAVATIHRPSNTDSPDTLRAWMTVLEKIAAQMPVIFPVHPRTRKALNEIGYSTGHSQLRLLAPLGYLDMIALVRQASVVLTDSGGVQEETTALGVRCLTLRDNTERPCTISEGTNRLAGSDPKKVFEAFGTFLHATLPLRMPENWDGRAAERIAQRLMSHADSTPSPVAN
jgi:UDP-N-acetylglucosamine 2-epimerase (non-hydrolysing)